MTDSQLETYYANLLILQYINQPKSRATIRALVNPVIMAQLPIAVQNAFAIDTAQGVQLDILGKYVGVTRNGYGTDGRPITLGDGDFVLLMKLAIITNNSGSSLSEIQGLLTRYFGNDILVSDTQNMSLNYSINSNFGSDDLLQLIVTKGLLPRPMGVGVSVTVITPGTGFFFGFRTYDAPAVNKSPFNSYPFYNSTTSPWLSYDDAI